jgi:hypothetical protein
MAGKREKFKRQIRRLYERQNGKCHWCGNEMKPPGTFIPASGKRPPPDLCTMEHLDDRWDPMRGKYPGQFRRVAACLACNNGRNTARLKELPIEVLWAASGSPKRRLERAA